MLQLRRSSRRAATRSLSWKLCAPLLHWSKMANVMRQWRYSSGTRLLVPMFKELWQVASSACGSKTRTSDSRNIL